jgi:hypothetical protein
MPCLGELVFVLAPIAGYRKYHICLGPNEAGVYLFLYLNSENGFSGDVVFDCARIPSIPASATGESVVSFSMVPRFTSAQLKLYGATSFGMLPKDVAQQLLEHCADVKTLTRSEKQFVLQALAAIAS